MRPSKGMGLLTVSPVIGVTRSNQPDSKTTGVLVARRVGVAGGSVGGAAVGVVGAVGVAAGVVWVGCGVGGGDVRVGGSVACAVAVGGGTELAGLQEQQTTRADFPLCIFRTYNIPHN